MISVADYFRDPSRNEEREHTVAQARTAEVLLAKVNALIDEAVAVGAFERRIDPDTGTEISGSRGGRGDGGYRGPDSKTGSPGSKHRLCRAVDVYDPEDRLDDWLSTFDLPGGVNPKLAEYGLYREAPSATSGWCHLQDLPPASGRRTYLP